MNSKGYSLLATKVNVLASVRRRHRDSGLGCPIAHILQDYQAVTCTFLKHLKALYESIKTVLASNPER